MTLTATLCKHAERHFNDRATDMEHAAGERTPDCNHLFKKAARYYRMARVLETQERSAELLKRNAIQDAAKAEMARPFIIITTRTDRETESAYAYQTQQTRRGECVDWTEAITETNETYTHHIVTYHNMDEATARMCHAQHAIDDSNPVYFERDRRMLGAWIKAGRPGAIMCDTDADLSSASEVSDTTATLTTRATSAQVAG